MVILPKLIHSVVCTKIPDFLLLVEIDKVILRFMWKYKGPRMAKIVLKARKKVGGLILHNFNTYKCMLMKFAKY